MKRREFVEKFAGHLERGTASLFVGAGLSHEAGFPTWERLLEDAARELGLEASREHDLAGLAQYYLNKHGRNRTRLSQLVRREFFKAAEMPEALRIIARLPIRHIWTTNYDRLIEEAWRLQRRQLDVKSLNSDLTTDDPWAHGILYKMHGSVDHPSDVVIAKNDYELYRRTRSGFLHVLLGDLISKHILFLGFGFRDPNVSHLFSMIREAFDDAPPEHYAIVRKPKRGRGKDAPEIYEYDKNRHNLWVQDLERYGINCVEVEEYSENDELLKEAERRLARHSVFVGGSYPEDGFDPEIRNKIGAVSEQLGEMIARRGLRLVSGFGLVVGSRVVAGAISKVLQSDYPNLEKALFLRPFPQVTPRGFTREQFFTRYREDLLQQCGVCIFVGGFRKKAAQPDELEMALGVLEEFDIARRLDRLCIPIGATGGAASEIWKRMKAARRGRRLPGNVFARLNDLHARPSELVDAVEKILDWYER